MNAGTVARFETLEDAIGRMSAGSRLNGVLVASFAAVAFVMAVIGVYGVLAFAVTQRTQEIGIRIALGAGPARVERLVLREGAVLVAIGAGVGVPASLAAGRLLKTLLYDITASDLRTYAAVLTAIGVSAMIAAWLPARRAASVDPMTALRE
jgi:ABC-type antimicrobial peptide transport system permease subunit